MGINDHKKRQVVKGCMNIWNDGLLNCMVIFSRECSIFCLFKGRRNGWRWVFTSVYDRGEGERGMLWNTLNEYNINETSFGLREKTSI